MPSRAIVDDGLWIAERLEDASILLEGLKPILGIRFIIASTIVIGSFGVILYNVPESAIFGIGQDVSMPDLSDFLGANGLIERADIGAGGLLPSSAIYLLPAAFRSITSKSERVFLENVAALNVAFYQVVVEQSLKVFNDELEDCPEGRRAKRRYEKEKIKIRRKIRVVLRKFKHKLVVRRIHKLVVRR